MNTQFHCPQEDCNIQVETVHELQKHLARKAECFSVIHSCNLCALSTGVPPKHEFSTILSLAIHVRQFHRGNEANMSATTYINVAEVIKCAEMEEEAIQKSMVESFDTGVLSQRIQSNVVMADESKAVLSALQRMTTTHQPDSRRSGASQTTSQSFSQSAHHTPRPAHSLSDGACCLSATDIAAPPPSPHSAHHDCSLGDRMLSVWANSPARNGQPSFSQSHSHLQFKNWDPWTGENFKGSHW